MFAPVSGSRRLMTPSPWAVVRSPVEVSPSMWQTAQSFAVTSRAGDPFRLCDQA
jgi:hypothetical protein